MASTYMIFPVGGDATRLKKDMPDLKMKCLLPITPQGHHTLFLLHNDCSIALADAGIQGYNYSHAVVIALADAGIQGYNYSYAVVKSEEQYIYLRNKTSIANVVKQNNTYDDVTYRGTLNALVSMIRSTLYQDQFMYASGDHVFEKGMVSKFMKAAQQVTHRCKTLTPETTVKAVVGVTQVTDPAKEALYYCDDQMVVRYMSQASHLPGDLPPSGLKPYADCGLAFVSNCGEFFQYAYIPFNRSLAEVSRECDLIIGIADLFELICPQAIDLTPFRFVNVNTVEDYARAKELRKTL